MTFTVKRTTVVNELNALVRTWSRIASDTSSKMHSSLDVLMEVMGYRIGRLAVTVYEGEELVGIAVHEAVHYEDLGTQDTHILELASFTHAPGVGKLLIDEVVKVAREEGSCAVTINYGPGAKGFYDRYGFVEDYRHPEVPNMMMYSLGGKGIPKG